MLRDFGIRDFLRLRSQETIAAYIPMSARTMRTRSAKTVPPGPAMGPRMVRAARKTDRVVRERVSRWPRGPRGGHSAAVILEGGTLLCNKILPITFDSIFALPPDSAYFARRRWRRAWVWWYGRVL